MNNLFKTSSIYLFSTVLASVIPFFLMPIMTRYLTQAEYGQIAMFQMLITALSAIVGFSVHGAANRKYFDENVSKETLQKFNGACFQILLFSAFLYFICLSFVKEWLGEQLGIPTNWLLLALIVCISSFTAQIRLGQWQIRNKAKYFGVFQISQSLLNALISIVFVVSLLQGAQGRIDAQVIAGFIFSVIAVYFMHKDKLISFLQWNPTLIREALSFGIPLIPHIIGGFLILSLDRIVINEELGLANVGIYMVAVQLSSVLKIVFHSINKAYVPWLYGELKNNNPEAKKNIVKSTYMAFISLLLLSGLAFLVGPFFVTLIAGEQYRASGSVIGLLCLGNIFNGMYLMVTNYIFYAKKTFRLSLVTIFSGIINIILLLLLIKPFGLIGAGLAFAISNFIMFIFAWLVSIKSYDMPWFSSFNFK